MGKAKGYGTKVLPNGTIFQGEWADSTLVIGKCLFPDGQIYEGEWSNGKPEGAGFKIWPDGRKYEG